MIKTLIVIAIINFDTHCQAIEPNPLKKEFVYHCNQGQSLFSDNIKKVTHSALSGSVALLNEPHHTQERIKDNCFNKYRISSTYIPISSSLN